MSRRLNQEKHPSRVPFPPNAVVESLSNQERYHYEKAILEMLESFKLGALRVQLSGSDSDHTSSSENEIDGFHSFKGSDPSNSKGSYLAKDKRRRHQTEDDLKGSTKSLMDIDVIYRELSSISKGLKRESKVLREKEVQLEQKNKHLLNVEQQLRGYEESIESVIEEEVQKRLEEAEKLYEEKLSQKSEDTSKWRNSFKISKQANEALRKQVQTLTDNGKELEQKIGTLQTRLTNMQRKNEILIQQSKDVAASKLDISDKDIQSKKLKPRDVKPLNDKSMELLTLLLGWLYESSFDQQSLPSSTDTQREFDVIAEASRDKCRKELSYAVVSKATAKDKALPLLCTFLPQISKEKGDCQLAFLRFLHFAILSLPSSQKGTLAATYRRIGEELLKPQTLESAMTDATSGKLNDHRTEGLKRLHQPGYPPIFLYSEDDEIRILSSVVILQTLTKVDNLVVVLESLKLDLRSEFAKEMFLRYNGTKIIHSFMKPTHKVLLTYSLDVLMMLAIESPFLTAFSESLSNQEWLTTIVLLLQNKGLNVKLLEKLVIILQKLSKLRANKRLFESLQVETMVHELIRVYKNTNPFLAVNLQSALFNISAMKSGSNLSQRALP